MSDRNDEEQKATALAAADWTISAGGDVHQQVVSGQGNVVAGRDLTVEGDLVTEEVAYNVSGLGCPYKGLKSYDYEDSDRFAGRDDESEAVMLRLCRKAQRTLLFVTGASGSGKSSFVKAGLLPKVLKHYEKRGCAHAIFKPARDPITALRGALNELGLPGEQLSDHAILADPTRLGTFLQEVQRPLPNQVYMLVIDQFEELFTQSDPAQRDALLAALEALPDFAGVRTHIVATLRSDYLPELFRRPQLYAIYREAGFDLQVMSPASLRAAILTPLNKAYPDKRFEEALLAKLVEEAAAEASYLTLLQVSIEDLWTKEPYQLKLSAFHGLGGAIQARADAVYNQLGQTDAARASILDIFLALVRVSTDPDEQQATKRQRALDELAEGDATRLGQIDALCDARLLTKDADERGEGEAPIVTVNIIHDTLIEHWPSLHDAIGAHRTVLVQRARFAQALRDWKDNERSEAYLLAGVRLAEAESLNKAGDQELRDSDAQDFLDASVEAREAPRRKAERQARRAQAISLAVSAHEQLEIDPERSVLLAIEAVRTTYQIDGQVVPQAEQVLHEALRHSQIRYTLRGHSGPVNAVACSPDGRTILTASHDGTAKLWDRVTGKEQTTLRGHTGPVNGAAYSSDGRTILTASHDKTAKLWDSVTGQERLTLRGHTSKVWSAIFSPDDNTVLTASLDKTARLWDTVTGQEWIALCGHADSVNTAHYSPDGKTIVTASDDRTAILWEVATAQKRMSLEGHTGPIWSAIFSSDGLSVLTASRDGTAKLWDGVTGQEQLTFSGHTGPVNNAVYSPDGQMILTASADGTAKLWEAVTGLERFTLRGHTGIVWSAGYSSEGQIVLTASDDSTVKLWNAVTIQERKALRGHTGPVNSAQYWLQGQVILTSSGDGTVKLWDVVTGDEQMTLHGHTGPVWNARYSPDGQTILTASRDSTARISRSQIRFPAPWNQLASGWLYTASGSAMPNCSCERKFFSAPLEAPGSKIVIY